MAINKNHEFEDLDGVKCAIVEKNASASRVAFLQNLLAYNSYKVIVVASPPPKVAAAKPAAVVAHATTEVIPAIQAPTVPETFTVGVTDVTFNAMNAVFGRLLHARNGQVVTLAYWNQQTDISLEEVPYFEITV